MKKVLSQIKSLPQIIKVILLIGIFVYLPLWFFTISLNSNQSVVLHEGQMPVLGSDSLEYKVLSQNISNHHFFSMDLKAPEYFRVPGYPLFISASKSIYNSYFFVTLFQVILTLITGLLIYKISILFVSNKLAIISSVLFLLEPAVIIHSLVLLSDIPFVFVLVLFTYLVFKTESSLQKYILLGLILGISVLFRPISMFLVLAFPFYIIASENIDVKKKIKFIIVFVLAFFIVVFPWMYRNRIHTGQYFISTISSYNVFYYNIPMFLSWDKGVTEEFSRENLYKENGLNKEAILLPINTKVLNKINIEFIKNNFIKYTYFHVYKTTSFFFGSSLKMSTTIYKSIFDKPISFNLFEKIVFLSERVLWLLMFLLSILSILNKKTRTFSIFCLFMILYFAILTGPVSYSRYRLPVEPYLFMVLPISIATIFDLFKKHIYYKKLYE